MTIHTRLHSDLPTMERHRRSTVHTRATPQLQDYLIDTARRAPAKVALVCGGRRVTYGEVEARSNALANVLARNGVRRGDRVIIFDDNTAEAVIGFWGVLKANAIVSIVSTRTRAGKLTYLLNDCRARA